MKKILEFVKRYWYLVPLLTMGLALTHTREKLADKTATLDTERKAWDKASKSADQQKKLDEARYEKSRTDALTAYAARQEARDPIIVRATNTVREYEKTDAGRALCFDAERVQQIQDNRTALFSSHP